MMTSKSLKKQKIMLFLY